MQELATRMATTAKRQGENTRIELVGKFYVFLFITLSKGSVCECMCVSREDARV